MKKTGIIASVALLALLVGLFAAFGVNAAKVEENNTVTIATPQ